VSDLARDFEGSGKEWRAPPVFSGQRPLPPELPPAGAPATPADADFDRDLADVRVELAAVRDAADRFVVRADFLRALLNRYDTRGHVIEGLSARVAEMSKGRSA
jgi:hypothetical protein